MLFSPISNVFLSPIGHLSSNDAYNITNSHVLILGPSSSAGTWPEIFFVPTSHITGSYPKPSHSTGDGKTFPISPPEVLVRVWTIEEAGDSGRSGRSSTQGLLW